MTNAIEQAKREMYDELENVRIRIYPYSLIGCFFSKFESQLEAYLELLRQDHEALHHTARARFEDTRKLEAANQELEASQKKYRSQVAELDSRLGKMTEERDSVRNKLQATESACETLKIHHSTSGQVSGDRASCATPDANTDAILKAVLDVKKIVTDWALNGLRAKTAIRSVSAIVNGKASVLKAMYELEKPATCMHSFHEVTAYCVFCGVRK